MESLRVIPCTAEQHSWASSDSLGVLSAATPRVLWSIPDVLRPDSWNDCEA
jgi:hypothetical protein